MSWNTVKLTDTAYSIEDNEVIPGSRVMIGSIVHPPGSDRWYVEIMRLDGNDVKGDFAKYETALAFVQGVETMQAIKERSGERPRG